MDLNLSPTACLLERLLSPTCTSDSLNSHLPFFPVYILSPNPKSPHPQIFSDPKFLVTMNAITQTPISSNSLIFTTRPYRVLLPRTLISLTRKTSIKSSVQTHKKFTKPSSLYDVLLVNRTATPGQIKSAYRTLAKKYHPDASLPSSDSQHFIEINKAYLTLSDPSSRALYDMKLGFAASFPQQGRVFERSGYYPAVRRWETDQCW